MNGDDLRIRLLDAESTPLYLQISQQIKHMIITQQLDDGAQLPAVRRLAEHLSINTGTVVQAYRELAGEHLVETVRGRGTVVRHLSTSSADEMARARLLERAADDLAVRARALGFEPDEVRTQISRALLGATAPVPVVFVARTEAQALRYTTELEQRYADRGVTFVPFGFESFAKGERDVADVFAVAYTVLTFVTMAPEVERVLRDLDHPAEIIGMTAVLDPATNAQLEAMSSEREYTLVTEARAVPAALAEVSSASGIDSPQIDVVAASADHDIDLDQLRAAADGDRVLIYTFGVKDEVLGLNLPEDRLIELRFALTDATVERLDAKWAVS